jgi:intraflagellar transport protein 172
VEMWTNAGEWENAHRVAKSFLPESEISALYMDNAAKMEKAQKFKEAEKLYLAVDKPDHAIAMYKRHRKFDAMIAVVSKHRKELLGESHKYLANQLEQEGNLREAEEHYASAGEWLAAVNMYRTNDNWEEAIRVAKFHGGINASKRVAYAYALHLGGSAGATLLNKHGLLEPAIDYAMESGAFDHAFELAKDSMPKKVPEVHLKYALLLEDEERFQEAETEFIHANKPREAIDMFIHQQSWVDALRVAERFDPSAVPDVYAAQGKAAAERGDFVRAEEMFVAASKPVRKQTKSASLGAGCEGFYTPGGGSGVSPL